MQRAHRLAVTDSIGVAIMLASAACAPELPDPAVDVIPDVPTCPGCTVRLESVVTLGAAADPVSTSEDAMLEPCAVGRLSSGEFVSGAPVGGGQLVVYDAAGRFSRTIGRQGQGPGEFAGHARVMVGPGDTLHILENDNARLQVLTSDGRFVRSFRLPARMSSGARLSSGAYALHPAWTTITEPGQPLYQLYSGEGDLLATAGSWDGVQVDWGQDWMVSPASSGGFWEGKESRLEAHLWSADGALQRSVRMDATWFPRDATLDPDFPFSPPPPANLTHLWEDDQQRLWLFVLATNSPWRPWPRAEETPDEPPPSWIEEMFHTRIEVIDVARGRLVASDSTDLVLMPMCGSSLVYSVTEAADGDTRVRVLRPSLEGG